MKKLLTLLILPIMLVFLFPVSASADTGAGIGPNSFFYFFDTTFENVNLFFTFDSEKKAQKALIYAEERLAEAEESANDNKPKDVEKVMEDYEKKISLATRKSKEVDDEEKAEELLNTVSESTVKHQEVLSGVLEKVSEEAKEAILKAIEVSKKGQEEALKQISDLQKEVSELKQELEEVKEKLENKDEEVKENDDNEKIEKLQKEIKELKQEAKQPKPQELETEDEEEVSETKKDEPKIVIFPNGSIVEIDENGNIIKTIKEAPKKSSENTTSVATQTNTEEIEINDINIIPTITSVKIEWETNKPTESKVFLSGGGLSSKVYKSESGLSTRHLITISGLSENTNYSYEIESISGDTVAKKQSSFVTKQTPPDILGLTIETDKTTVPLNNWETITIKVRGIKNGQSTQGKSMSITTSNDSQIGNLKSRSAPSNDSQNSYFTYTPLQIGADTITFTWEGYSESINIKVVPFIEESVQLSLSEVRSPISTEYIQQTFAVFSIQAPSDENIIVKNYTYEILSEDFIYSDIPTLWHAGGQSLLDFTIQKGDSLDFWVRNQSIFDKTGNFQLKITDMEIIGAMSGLRRTTTGFPITTGKIEVQ